MKVDDKIPHRSRMLLYSTLELLRKQVRSDFYDWKDADDWLFAQLDFTKDELQQIYKGRNTMVYIGSAVELPETKNRDSLIPGYEPHAQPSTEQPDPCKPIPVIRVSLLRERMSEMEQWTDEFWVDIQHALTAELFRKAAEEFLYTAEGQLAIEQTSRDFNWGDAVIYVPQEIWNKHGIYPCDCKTPPEAMGLTPTSSENFVIAVDTDERLIPQNFPLKTQKNQEKGTLLSQIKNAESRIITTAGADHVPRSRD